MSGFSSDGSTILLSVPLTPGRPVIHSQNGSAPISCRKHTWFEASTRSSNARCLLWECYGIYMFTTDSMGYKYLKWQLWLNCSFQLWDVRSLHSQIVGPVTYMWRPFSRADDKSEIEGDPCTSHSIHNESGNSSRRQLWIWIHPAALDEGISVIRFACERQVLPQFLI